METTKQIITREICKKFQEARDLLDECKYLNDENGLNFQFPNMEGDNYPESYWRGSSLSC